MRKIKYLVEHIYEEIDDAEKYYICAIKNDDDTKAKAVFIDLAKAEIDHAMKLHDLVVEETKKVKETGVTIPEAMLEIWNMEHTRIIEKVDDLKNSISRL